VTTTLSLEQLILRRHPMPAWAVFFEVGNSTGFSTNRWADAVAIGIWPSHGHKIHGFEVKRSRGDWLRELKDPKKADAVSKFCDHWWLVAKDKSVALGSEIPDTWGLLVPRGDSLVAVRDAPKREPMPLTKGFVSAMLRRVSETTVPKADYDQKILEQAEKLRKQREGIAERDLARATRDLAELRKSVDDFQTASGIKLDQWSYGESLGKAVEFARNPSNMQRARAELEHARRTLERALKNVDDGLIAASAVETPEAAQ
jgi:hypothetical protein